MLYISCPEVDRDALGILDKMRKWSMSNLDSTRLAVLSESVIDTLARSSLFVRLSLETDDFYHRGEDVFLFTDREIRKCIDIIESSDVPSKLTEDILRILRVAIEQQAPVLLSM